LLVKRESKEGRTMLFRLHRLLLANKVDEEEAAVKGVSGRVGKNFLRGVDWELMFPAVWSICLANSRSTGSISSSQSITKNGLATIVTFSAVPLLLLLRAGLAAAAAPEEDRRLGEEVDVTMATETGELFSNKSMPFL